MKILFTVCGRAGSKGIKNKNCRDFLGKPLVYYTLSAISLYIKENPRLECDVVLNTDSEKLIELIEQQKMVKTDVVHRKSELAGDSTPKVAVILDCLNEMEKRKKTAYDMVVDLDITSPLRTVEDIKNLIQKKQNAECDVVFSVTEARRNPYFNMVKKTDNGYERVIPSNFNARQEAPEIFDMNASLYAYEPEFLREQKSIFDGKCEAIKMMDTGVLDLDHENDFVLMEVIGKYLFKIKRKFKIICERINFYEKE